MATVSLLSVLFSFSIHFTFVHSILQNLTIDDSNGDPINGQKISYSPADAWNSGACTRCDPQPDSQRAFSGTWTEGTYTFSQDLQNKHAGTPISASVSFFGTAVYVFCIIAQTRDSLDGGSNMLFYVDDELRGSFVQPASDNSGFIYNTCVFSATGLAGSTHKLMISDSEPGSSRVILDYILYTQDDGRLGPPNQPQPNPPVTQVLPAPSTSKASISLRVSDRATSRSSTLSQLSSTLVPKSTRSSTPIVATGITATSSSSSPSSPSPSFSTSSSTLTQPQPSPSTTRSGGTSPPLESRIDRSEPSRTGPSPGKVAGAVFGGISALALIVIIGLCHLRFRKRPQSLASQLPESPVSISRLLPPNSPLPSTQPLDILDQLSIHSPNSDSVEPVARPSVGAVAGERSSSLHGAYADNNLPPYGVIPRRLPLQITKVYHVRPTSQGPVTTTYHTASST